MYFHAPILLQELAEKLNRKSGRSLRTAWGLDATGNTARHFRGKLSLAGLAAFQPSEVLAKL